MTRWPRNDAGCQWSESKRTTSSTGRTARRASSNCSRDAANSSSTTSCLRPVSMAGRLPAARAARWSSDYIGPLAHLHARDTSLALVSRAPLANLEAYKRRMGWNVPWYSSAENDFNDDFGLTTGEGETFGLSAFLRDGENVFHTYFTTDRALEAIDSNFTLLDWTVLGRQEEWEDSPAGWPQSAPYVWWRRHDEYKQTQLT